MQKKIIEIQRRDPLTIACQLDIAQRADLLHTTADKQGICHGRQTAHRVRAGFLSLAEHEHPDRTKFTHGDADPRSDELLRHAMFNPGTRGVESHAADDNGSKLGEFDPSVALYG